MLHEVLTGRGAPGPLDLDKPLSTNPVHAVDVVLRHLPSMKWVSCLAHVRRFVLLMNTFLNWTTRKLYETFVRITYLMLFQNNWHWCLLFSKCLQLETFWRLFLDIKLKPLSELFYLISEGWSGLKIQQIISKIFCSLHIYCYSIINCSIHHAVLTIFG